jgi:YbbR domain-containing protein
MRTNPARPPAGERSESAAQEGRPLVRRIAEVLERDMGLRLISLALAIGLWIFVNAGQHGAIQSFQVPVSYRELPPGFVVTNPHPDFVRIQVSGPRTLLSIIDPTHLTLRLELGNVGIGQASFKIGPDSFPVPRHTEVTGVQPSQIVLDIDKEVTREVPVHLALSGAPGTGYKIASTEVTPATVGIRAPSRVIGHIDQVDTEAVPISGITSELSRSVNLLSPASSVRLKTDTVTVKITLALVITQKEFQDVPIRVRDTDRKFRIEPHHVNLELSGPLLKLAKIDLKSAVYVEAAGLGRGSHSVSVQINLPDGVTLVHQAPEKVKLRIYDEKRAAPG